MRKLIKPVILGPDGHPVARARDRLAPKPNVGAGLEGWVSWGLIDRKGREVQGGEQHNLILDTFLDRIATDTGLAGLASFNTFLSHHAVGTGSTPPAVTDTALANELARTTTIITNTTTRTANGVYNLVLEREFDFGAANGNLTEFGFSYGASSPMLVRELFRDSGGNPITITKTADYKLRLKYTLTVTLTPVTLSTPASFGITGIGTINGAHSWNGNADGADLAVFAMLAQGRVQSFPQGGSVIAPYLASVIMAGYNTDLSVFLSSSISSVDSVSAFTPGTHQRSITASWSTAVGNVSGIRSLAIGRGTKGQPPTGGRQGAWAFAIDSGSAFTKDNLHTLTINDLLTVSWGRA